MNVTDLAMVSKKNSLYLKESSMMSIEDPECRDKKRSKTKTSKNIGAELITTSCLSVSLDN